MAILHKYYLECSGTSHCIKEDQVDTREQNSIPITEKITLKLKPRAGNFWDDPLKTPKYSIHDYELPIVETCVKKYAKEERDG